MLGLDQLLATALAHTEMAAWHDKRVLGVREANEALSIRVVILDSLLALLCTLFVLHSID